MSSYEFLAGPAGARIIVWKVGVSLDCRNTPFILLVDVRTCSILVFRLEM